MAWLNDLNKHCTGLESVVSSLFFGCGYTNGDVMFNQIRLSIETGSGPTIVFSYILQESKKNFLTGQIPLGCFFQYWTITLFINYSRQLISIYLFTHFHYIPFPSFIFE